MAKIHNFPLMLDGVQHQVEAKFKQFSGKIIVSIDGQEVAKKTDWMGTTDVLFSYQGHNIAVTKQRYNFRLAVDGKFTDNGEDFVPLPDMPGIIKIGMALSIVEVFLSIILVGGILGAALGLIAYLILTSIGRSRMSKGAKIGFTILILVLLYGAYAMLALTVVSVSILGAFY